MAKSAYDLFKEKVDPSEIGNPQLRQQLRSMYEENYQEQLNQVNANYQEWRAENENVPISEYFAQARGQKEYVVKDGDTLTDISKNTGAPEKDILNTNPDMKAPQTGMVLNVPAPGSEAWRVQNAYGGLPSNAALGATTTNPMGANYAAASNAQLQTYGAALGGAQEQFKAGGTLTGFAPKPSGYGYTSPQGGGYNPFAPAVAAGSIAGGVPSPATAGAPQPSVIAPNAPGFNRREKPQSYRPDVQARSTQALIQKVSDKNYTPTDVELQVLTNLGLLRRASPQANGGMYGNYSYSSFRRRGYGGGGRQSRAPAFSSGGGFRGLVNWRI